jgi:sulfate permease, SulP family
VVRLLPDWALHYPKGALPQDVAAGVIMTVLLIPQNLAYAILAGLPPELGLYATVLPVVAYALFGSSMVLSFGPAAIGSLMTAAALHGLAVTGSPQYQEMAVALALMGGAMCLVFGWLKLGFLAHFLSHPVLSGFTSGSAVLILVGQLPALFGLQRVSGNVFEALQQLAVQLPSTNGVTLGLGLVCLLALLLARRYLSGWLQGLGLSQQRGELAAKLAPLAVVVCATVVVWAAKLSSDQQVAIVGVVPSGLPKLANPLAAYASFGDLWLSALLIALVGFVQSVSVAQAMALRRQEKINPDRELIGLGAANLASAVSGAYPIAGGLARTAVSFAAGARTPLAGIVSAICMVGILLSFTGTFYYMPNAVLAAVIVLSIASLVDFKTLRQAWHYDRADALALMVTFSGVLLMGVQQGIVVGVVVSLLVLVWRSSRPHVAVVGRVPGTEHFRNVERHGVDTLPALLALRVDESLFFANISAIEEKIMQRVEKDPSISSLLLICSAVNRIDSTALGVLTELESNLSHKGIALCLAEVKGPVMDRLAPTVLGNRLKGRVFLSTHDAFVAQQVRQTHLVQHSSNGNDLNNENP